MDNVHLGIGAGVIGDLEEEMEEEAFLEKIKKTFHCGVVKHTALRGQPVKKVALCGGSGSFLLPDALKKGANFFITADIKYHEFFDSGRKLVIADIGHYESEQFTIDLLHGLLVENFPTFAVLKTEVSTNPVKYFV
jgi:putative NIF3 family GTP cyclohydrolase 1 type 2